MERSRVAVVRLERQQLFENLADVTLSDTLDLPVSGYVMHTDTSAKTIKITTSGGQVQSLLIDPYVVPFVKVKRVWSTGTDAGSTTVKVYY